MPFVPVDKTAQIEMVFDWQGQIVENVYHVLQASEFDESALNTIVGTFQTWWQTNMRALHHLGITLNKIKARSIATNDGLGIEVPVTTNNVGTANGTPYPNNVALAVKWTTIFSGRSFRGRTYHMGIVSSNTESAAQNQITPTYQSAILAGYGALLTAVNIGDQHLVVVSRRSNNAPRVAGLATPIVHVTVNKTLDSQRRRLPERGQ